MDSLMPATFKNGKRYSLSNTCAFDAMFHLLLVGVFDDLVPKHVLRNKDFPMSKILEDVTRSGITSATYNKRAEILLNSPDVTVEELPYNINYVNCVMPISALCDYLFQEIPSVVESFTCHCQDIRVTTISVPSSTLHSKDLKHFIV